MRQNKTTNVIDEQEQMDVTVYWSATANAYIARSFSYPTLSGISKTQTGALKELATEIDKHLKPYHDFKAMIDSRTAWVRELEILRTSENLDRGQSDKLVKLTFYKVIYDSLKTENIKVYIPVELASSMFSCIEADTVGWRDGHVFVLRNNNEFLRIELHDAEDILNHIANRVFIQKS